VRTATLCEDKKKRLRKKDSAMTDSEVIELFHANRNQECFNLLYKRYSLKVFQKCISLIHDKERAEDATQEIFIKIFLNLSKFNHKSNFSTWIYAITHNHCIDLARKIRKEKHLFSDQLENTPDIIDDNDQSNFGLMEIKLRKLKIVLDRLEAGDKKILIMKYRDSLKVREIAKIYNKTESAIKMRLKRARNRLQKNHELLYAEG